MNKQETLQAVNTDNSLVLADLLEQTKAAFKRKQSAIDSMIAYCDANGLTYSAELSSYVLNQYHK